MLNSEEREELIRAYEECYNVREVAQRFSVSRSTVYNLIKRKVTTGSIEPLTHKRGRKPILSDTDLECIDKMIQDYPHITIDGIINKLGRQVSHSVIKTAINRLGYMYDRRTLKYIKIEDSVQYF